MTTSLDPVTLEVIRNALPAVANEMAADLQRTSYNMMIYEVRDFCTALLAPNGDLVSQNVGGVSHFVADLGVTDEYDVDCIRCHRCIDARDVGLPHRPPAVAKPILGESQ